MNTDRETRMALLLKALEDMDIEKVGYIAEWKDRRAKLESDLRTLKYDILQGQGTLFIAGGNGNGAGPNTPESPDQPHEGRGTDTHV